MLFMAAYFIVDVQVNDPVEYEDYRKRVMPTLECYGGKFIVRGGASQTIEGDWAPQRLVIIEFEDEAQFKGWYYSPEYEEAKAIRFRTSTARAILIEGV
jgi:uncharacterized protein (DUF1330 family)